MVDDFLYVVTKMFLKVVLKLTLNINETLFYNLRQVIGENIPCIHVHVLVKYILLQLGGKLEQRFHQI